MGLVSSSGLSVRFNVNPSSGALEPKPQNLSSRLDCAEPGGTGLVRKEGCSSGHKPKFNRFHKFFVCGSQKKWRKSPSGELKTTESIFNVRTLQDGRCSHASRSAEEGRPSSKDRSKRCLFDSSNLERSSKVFALYVKGDNAGVCLRSIHSNRTQGFHKVNETSGSHVEAERCASNYLFRRHIDNGRIRESGSSPCSLDSKSFGESGICNKLRKIPADPYSANQIFRFPNQFGNFVAPVTRREVTENKETMLTVIRSRGNLSTRIIKIPTLLTFSIQAVVLAPLHYRNLQRLKNLSLSTLKSYEAVVLIDPPAKEEIIWWRDHLQGWNGKALFQSSVDLVIETDASRKGWGAYCEGISTGGPSWYAEEKHVHINCLELLAGSFAIKTFWKNKAVAHVKLLMDNTSAVAYINKMGGTHSQTLANLVVALWNWRLKHQIHVSAEHLPAVLNLRADRESREVTDPSNWKLDPTLFQALLQKWGPLDVDLFASQLTCQLAHFVSWKPDPQAIQTDAFLMDWKGLKGYAFPPFALIGRCLRQVMSQGVDQLVLVAPVWPAQPWYSVLLHLAVDKRLLFPITPELLMKENQAHPLTNLQLAGWVLSANISKHQAFQRKCQKHFISSMARKHLQCILFCLEQWVGWCRERQINPVSVPLNSILEF